MYLVWVVFTLDQVQCATKELAEKYLKDTYTDVYLEENKDSIKIIEDKDFLTEIVSKWRIIEN